MSPGTPLRLAPLGSRERNRLDDEPTHDEPSYPAAEHVASLADLRLIEAEEVDDEATS